jgi:HK97 family phage major capsid protein
MDYKQYHSEVLGKIDEFADAAKANHDDLRSRLETLEAYGDRPRGDSSGTHEEKSFLTYLRTGGREIASKEMSIGGGAAAGDALVPEVISNDIINQALSQSMIAKRVRRTQVSSSDYVHLVNLRGQSASWSSETGTRSATDTMQFRERRPTHGELYSLVTVSNWLLQDAKFPLMNMIRENAAAQFAKALDAAIYNGDGSNKPTGIFNTAPVSTSDTASPIRDAAAIQYVSTGGDAADDVYSLYFTLAPEYRHNSTFAMSSGVLSSLRQLRDSSGSGFLWQQNLGSSVDAPDGLLAGRPVATWEDLTSSYTQSPVDYPLLCGDFQAGYEITEIGPMSVILDQVTTKGKTLVFLYQRFGGCIIDNNAIKCVRA